MKSYTDLEQSKKLAEILPLESADMFYHYNVGIKSYYEDTPRVIQVNNHFVFFHRDIPCWSLAALLNVMPKDKSVECAITFGYYNGKGKYIEKWLCAFEKEGETTDDYIIETFDGDNPVDACYQMVIRLKEKNLL